jgi:hypothetical protein
MLSSVKFAVDLLWIHGAHFSTHLLSLALCLDESVGENLETFSLFVLLATTSVMHLESASVSSVPRVDNHNEEIFGTNVRLAIEDILRFSDLSFWRDFSKSSC